jgi:hypothetical protein
VDRPIAVSASIIWPPSCTAQVCFGDSARLGSFRSERMPNARFASNENDLKKFLLNSFRPGGAARARFSLAADVVAFSGLIDLATDQSFVSRNAQK